MDKLDKVPATEPFWLLDVTALVLANPLTFGVPEAETRFQVMGDSVPPFPSGGNVTVPGGTVRFARGGLVAGSAPRYADVRTPLPLKTRAPAAGGVVAAAPVRRLSCPGAVGRAPATSFAGIVKSNRHRVTGVAPPVMSFTIDKVALCEVPLESNIWTVVENVEPVGAEASRFIPRSNCVVAVGDTRLFGTTMLETPPLLLINPVTGSRWYPSTFAPPPETRFPFESRCMLPARVYKRVPL